MNKDWTKLTKKECESFPRKQWDQSKKYDSLLFMPTKHKHDSGYNRYLLVGVSNSGYEIAGHLDDLCISPIGCENELRMDCSMHGIFHFWSNTIGFLVEDSISSINVQLYEKKQG